MHVPLRGDAAVSLRILKIVTVLAALCFISLVQTPARACPNCKDAVAAQEPAEAARLKNGYFYSILLMVSMPIVLTGAGAILLIRAVKRGALPEL
jgi:hypothetical protein